MAIMMTPDVNVYLMNFPSKGKEMVVPNEDGSYTIFLNARLSYEEQLKAYQHAIDHIKNQDFQKSNVQEIEAAAHKMVSSSALEIRPKNKYEDRIKRIQRKRKKIQKQLAERQKAIEFLQAYLPEDYFFQAAEYHKLYGNDL